MASMTFWLVSMETFLVFNFSYGSKAADSIPHEANSLESGKVRCCRSQHRNGPDSGKPRRCFGRRRKSARADSKPHTRQYESADWFIHGQSGKGLILGSGNPSRNREPES